MSELKEIMDITLLDIGESGLTIGELLSVAALVLLGAFLIVWSGRIIREKLGRKKVNADLLQVISRAYIILGFVVLSAIALDILGIPLAAFAFVSGAIAIGVGFGAQNIINNFISGWILMWERPIRIDDFLEIGDVRGNVESINTRSTCIRRVDGVRLLVPNSYLLENTVTNWTLIDKLVRTSVRVGVEYGSDVNLVTELLKQAAEEHTDVLKEPGYAVLFDDFGDSSLIFELNVWALATAERGLRLIRSDLRYRIDALFRANNVVISYPQRDVHVDGTIIVDRGQAS
ncbi:mechanosensitive ion channel [Halioglobus maricola]|uniref:Mechanosensitive ion channel n=1 Tax=Halioglobus maricola TaxID=2601894 RepID=A0A5P9NH05_9GAMM|nr:mechanosensitive ion channel domain-containing protein [Halioglobus maricola]QFU75107.1 mechanosensitive ion channel [Halioglobus maricola]